MMRKGTLEPFKVAFTVDLKDEYFIHAVFLQELNLDPYEIYVGSDSDWRKNRKFAGPDLCGPYEGFNELACTESRLGETWTNVPGRFITFYADFTDRFQRSIHQA